MRRVLIALVAVVVLAAGRAEAVTIRDLIELSKAGLGDEVLIALIEVDRQVFNIDAATLKKMKEAGVSETVIVALIRSGRTAARGTGARARGCSDAPAGAAGTGSDCHRPSRRARGTRRIPGPGLRIGSGLSPWLNRA